MHTTCKIYQKMYNCGKEVGKNGNNEIFNSW